jgi:hypothetical protein
MPVTISDTSANEIGGYRIQIYLFIYLPIIYLSIYLSIHLPIWSDSQLFSEDLKSKEFLWQF